MSRLNKYKIVTMGGGTGAPIVQHSLVLAGFRQINAICASMDSGGHTGRIRSDERDQVIAISDLLRNLLSLIPKKKNTSSFRDLMSYVDGRQRNLGYTIYYALLEKYDNNHDRVQEHFTDLLGHKFYGRAIPVTLESTTLCFRTRAGNVYHGEHELDQYSMSKDCVTHVWLDPPVTASPEAYKAIREATHIIYCPGSLYGSVIVNLLPEGIVDALSKTKAQKILVSNLVSTRNETHKITPYKYLELFQKYAQIDKPFDVFIAPHISRKEFERKNKKIVKHYQNEHSHFLGWNKKEIKALRDEGINVIEARHYSVTKKLNRLRHDPKKLSKILSRIMKDH